MKCKYLLPLVLLAGCTTQPNHQPNHQGIDWGQGTCPAPDPQSISPNHQLVIEDGKTLKCQLRPYVSNMACQGIVDSQNEGVICQDNVGNQIIFLFVDKGVLSLHRSLRSR